MLLQIASLAGALLILFAYVALQLGWLTAADRMYNVLNLVGSLLLLWVAVADWRWGFMLLEGAWAAISLAPLVSTRTAPGR